jgi:hypothetical protein
MADEKSKHSVLNIIILVAVIIVYYVLAFLIFLPQCLIVWYPAGVNEFIFCFILPPIVIAIIYLLYKIKSKIITSIVTFICFIAILAWFGPNFFFRFFTRAHMIFQDCVNLLNVLSNVFGLSYEAINVLIFCLFEPMVFIIMLYVIIKQRKIINDLRMK